MEQIPVGAYPYTVASRRRQEVYVSNWGGRRADAGDMTDGAFPVVLDPRTGIPSSGTVSVIDTKTRTVLRHIDVGLHPSGMALSPRRRPAVRGQRQQRHGLGDRYAHRPVRGHAQRAALAQKAPLGARPTRWP